MSVYASAISVRADLLCSAFVFRILTQSELPDSSILGLLDKQEQADGEFNRAAVSIIAGAVRVDKIAYIIRVAECAARLAPFHSPPGAEAPSGRRKHERSRPSMAASPTPMSAKPIS